MILVAGGRVVIVSLLALLVVFLSAVGQASAAGAASVTVVLSPASILANGSSTAAVTGVVTDSSGNPLRGETVYLSVPADRGIAFSPSAPVTVQNGTYSSTLTGSNIPEQVTVVAVDGNAVVHPATLTQLAPSTTSLAAAGGGQPASANSLVTNQGVTLVSTVTTVAPTVVPPSGTVEFQNGGTPVSGCGAVQIPAQSSASVAVTCATSFAAPSSPARLTAVFHPTPGLLVSSSASPPDAFSIFKDSTSTTVITPTSTPTVRAPVTYTAVIAPAHAGQLTPTGQVTFADDGRAITSCNREPVAGSMTATCTVRYRTTGRHTITASYGGDGSFEGSNSPGTAIGVQPLGTIAATMQWQFYYTPTYTRVLLLRVNGVSPGETIVLKCHGGGCPFAKRNIAVHRARRCRAKGPHRCDAAGPVDLASRFGGSRLAVASRITVEIARPGWVAKDYVFAVRPRGEPGVRISCTAPGRTAIGVGC